MASTDSEETKQTISESLTSPPTITVDTGSGWLTNNAAPITHSEAQSTIIAMFHNPRINPILNHMHMPGIALPPGFAFTPNPAAPYSGVYDEIMEAAPEPDVDSGGGDIQAVPSPHLSNHNSTNSDKMPEPRLLPTASEPYRNLKRKNEELHYTDSPSLQPSSDQFTMCRSGPGLPDQATNLACHNGRQFELPSSSASEEWNDRKLQDGETNEILDELMQYQGLEEVKQQFLDIKSKVDCCKEQGRDLKSERFNIVFQGNPGTGKTTVARLYAKFLCSLDLLGSEYVEETTGVKVATDGASKIKDTIDEMISEDGGILFVDEAYQLTAPYMNNAGRPALDIILTAMENNIGEFVAIFVGYKDEMESFFEHNTGLRSRIPYTMHFADFTDGELWKILSDTITKEYNGKMQIEGGMDGLYMRVAIRRLAQNRGSRGFGNARAVQNLLAKISQRQARRLTREKRHGNRKPDYLLFQREDLIGPDPATAAYDSEAWVKLRGLIGLNQVKERVRSMIRTIRLNYCFELQERRPLEFSLNQLFVGNPGTGKTTVAKLYGRILADLGYLSNGEVVLKNASDFIGDCLGKSETRTRNILEANVGKVLVIDEAYMLDPGDPNKGQDKFKTGIIDTIVSMVQGMPGEDRCIILIGYEDQIKDMFRNSNPGLSRRFPIDRPFRFENFDILQLEQILRKKLDEQELEYTDHAISVAREVLERSLMRPNFTNAGEVDALLTTVKTNYETRLSRMPSNCLDVNMEVVAADFDPDYERGSRIDCRKIMEGLVHDSITNKLVGYQNQYFGAKKYGINPRDQIPSRFVFKGPSGTGKTTTARKMGEIFYGMGLIATPEVLECSVADLVGQYVGQTAPQTRKKLQEGIGRVIFIDEANRFLHGQYATEAVDELIQFLTQTAHESNTIVIMAGYTAEMHKLMSLRPNLASLFPEEITFDNIPPKDCVVLLAKELGFRGLKSEGDFLANPNSQAFIDTEKFFHDMQSIPGWSNARDVKNLSKRIIGRFLESANHDGIDQIKAIRLDLVISCISEMATQRRDRSINIGPSQRASSSQQLPIRGAGIDPMWFNSQVETPPTPPILDTCTLGEEARCSVTDYRISVETRGQDRGHSSTMSQTDAMHIRINGLGASGSTLRDSLVDEDKREEGVPEAVWQELCEAKTVEKALHNKQAADIKRLERHLQKARDSGDQLKIDSLWDQLTAIQREMQEKKKVQEALKTMGRCVAGFAWSRVGGGWRCEGGTHFATDAEVQARL